MNDDDLRLRLEQAERALERSERMAVASRYASAIIHEVNNPLEAITNLVYLTKLERHSPEHVLANMQVVEEQLRTLGRVTAQVLTYHRQQSQAKEFDLIEIAESALRLHAEKLSRHGLRVDRRFRGPVMVEIFGSEILQVVSNLVLNAVEAQLEGGEMLISVKRCHECVQLTVIDRGPGIPEAFANRLFEPYVTTKATGTGLGLWLSRRIVEKHRGTLRFRTSRDAARSGTAFRLTLPATKLRSVPIAEVAA